LIFNLPIELLISCIIFLFFIFQLTYASEFFKENKPIYRLMDGFSGLAFLFGIGYLIYLGYKTVWYKALFLFVFVLIVTNIIHFIKAIIFGLIWNLIGNLFEKKYEETYGIDGILEELKIVTKIRKGLQDTKDIILGLLGFIIIPISIIFMIKCFPE